MTLEMSVPLFLRLEMVAPPLPVWLRTRALIYQSCMNMGADLSVEWVVRQDMCDLRNIHICPISSV